MDLNELRIKDGIKIYVDRVDVSRSEFVGYVYALDLSDALRDRLARSGSDDDFSVVDVAGHFSVRVEDASSEQAVVTLEGLSLFADAEFKRPVAILLDEPGIEPKDIEEQIEGRIEWTLWFADWRSGRADAALDLWNDSKEEM